MTSRSRSALLTAGAVIAVLGGFALATPAGLFRVDPDALG
jgi:hypothetical protein